MIDVQSERDTINNKLRRPEFLFKYVKWGFFVYMSLGAKKELFYQNILIHKIMEWTI